MLAEGALRFNPAVDVLMTPRPITIEPTVPLAAAAERMRTCRIRHLPVAVDGALVGVVSLGDVLATDGAAARVADVMGAPAETAAPATPLGSACARMLRRRIGCLPVVDGARLAGVFTATDALRFAASALDEEARARRPPAVAQLMAARPAVTVAPATPLAIAWQRMRADSVRHLPVVRDGAIVGMLSDHDLLAAAAGPARLVGEAMSTRVSTIDAARPASEAAATLLRRRIGALPVLCGRELDGIIAASDFVRYLAARA